MNYQEMSNNKLVLTGEVLEPPVYSHELFGEGFYETKLQVMRLSKQFDIVPITISERLIKLYNIEVGKNITIEGQFRSYNKIEEEKSKLMLTAFVRDIVEKDEENPNSIELTGFICKAPIYRTTPFKREICDVLLAVNRAYNKSDYIPCIFWGRNARFIKNMQIGEKISLSGRVQSRNYTKIASDNTVIEHVAYEVSVNKIMIDKPLQISLQVRDIANYEQ
ncbi:MAG: single-stranded DNA-binding protein [Clostridia bacterium]